MACVAEADAEFGGDLFPSVVGDGLDHFNDASDISFVIEGESLATAGGEVLVEVEGVFLLDVGGVVEHDFGDVESRRSAEDGAGETGFDESGEIAAVVDVGVREDDGVEVAGVAGELFVFLSCFGSVSLKESAVEEEAELSAFDKVLAAGDFLGGPVKGDLHERDFLIGRRKGLTV